MTFEEVEEQVTSKDVTNLRSTMEQTDDSNVVVKLQNGETATGRELAIMAGPVWNTMDSVCMRCPVI